MEKIENLITKVAYNLMTASKHITELHNTM